MLNLGDFQKGDTVYVPWNTSGADGASITRATNGTVSVYSGNGTTQFTTGVTDTEDFDGLTGVHLATIVTTGSDYVVNGTYTVVLSAATIDGVTVNAAIAQFTINRKHAMQSLAGIAQAGAAGTITLPAAAVATDDYYNGQMVRIIYGTGIGQSRMIDDYVGSTKVATVTPSWATTPDNTSVIEVIGTAPASTGSPMAANMTQILGTAVATPATAGLLDVNVKEISSDSTAADNAEAMFDGTGYAGGTIKQQVDIAAIAPNAITASALASDAAAEIAAATNDDAIARLDGLTASDTTLVVDGVAYDITRDTDGYITSIVAA